MVPVVDIDTIHDLQQRCGEDTMNNQARKVCAHVERKGDSQLNVVHESLRFVQELLQEEGDYGLLHGAVLHDRARVEVLPQCPSVVSPPLPIRDQTEGPFVSRTKRNVVDQGA